MEIKERIEQLTEDMIQDLGDLVKHPSKRGDALPDKPFGEGPAAALAEALRIAEEMGFKTKNLDNYCGYAEIGEGKDIIGLVAHLDVVPEGDGWDTDPYTVTRKGDVLYGRGVSDDKGGAIASLYTLKLIQELNIPLNKRIRVLLGCNEETGSQCMAHYNEVEEPITIGFTPDGSFPGIYGEKGMLNMSAFSKNTKILSMEGGFVSNAVCHHCVTKVPADAVDEAKLKEALAKTPLAGFTLSKEDDALVIDAQGVSAHASTPLLGVNAASFTMQALAEAGMEDDFVDYYNSHIGTTCDGAGYNLKLQDDYGELTLNNGIVRMTDGAIECTIDIRVPVTYNEEQLRALLADRLEDEKGKTVINAIGKPLFFPKDSPMVKALQDAYVKVTGDTESPLLVIGGGTYAKSIPGIIAFGCEFPGVDNHIHDANERLEIRELKLQVEIYTEAVKNLLAL
ncbi:MAG: M20 family metallopeptidase [Lachnospiraceae bacterium]|nr:M20 family metallopeptidase [Lachnospiraceae bacterium]